MLDKFMSSSSPPTLRQIASSFRLTGWISLWSQSVLTIVSSGILVFAATVSRNPTSGANNPSTGLGATLTTIGIFILLFTIYWSFRYIQIGRKLLADPAVRPKKSETIQVLRIGLIASLAGMLVALIGAEATVGALAAKAFSQGLGGFVNVDPSKFIQPLDILVVQASINVIFGQFVGIAATLRLLNRMSR
jgi:hypothetical protein